MRRLDWPERLAVAVEAGEHSAFSDIYFCAIFAADCYLAMTDVDPLAEVRGRALVDCYAWVRGRGYGNVREALAAIVGPEVPLAFARRGDIVLRLAEDGLDAIGVCLGQHSAFVAGAEQGGGLAHLPTLEQVAAFRVR